MIVALSLSSAAPPADGSPARQRAKRRKLAFVSFSVSAVSARRFSEYWTGTNRDQIGTYFNKTIRWTFWPSLIGAALILIAGKPLLAMFGPDFSSGYALIGIMAVGLIVQASTGPMEALLNMLHQERACAAVYGISCIFNLLFCVLLIPPLGPVRGSGHIGHTHLEVCSDVCGGQISAVALCIYMGLTKNCDHGCWISVSELGDACNVQPRHRGAKSLRARCANVV